MTAHLIIAHPEPGSFTKALSEVSKDVLQTTKHNCLISDLYEMQFDPVAGPWEFTRRQDETYFNLMNEQKHAEQNHTCSADIRGEHTKLLQADLIIFHFPMWWWSAPAILKGWFDRVLTNGFAYGADKKLRGKKTLLVISAETSGEKFTPQSRLKKDILTNIEEGTLQYVGLEVIPAFIAHSIYKVTDKQRQLYLIEYKNYLTHILHACSPKESS